MSAEDLYSQNQTLYRHLIFLINHRKSPELFTEDKLKSKKIIREILTTFNQYLHLDIDGIPDRDPGLEAMLSYDLGITLTPNTPD